MKKILTLVVANAFLTGTTLEIDGGYLAQQSFELITVNQDTRQ